MCAVVLAVDVLRGGRGEAEGGEDVDLSHPSDWRTLLLLVAAFVANVVLIEPVGWWFSGAVLFLGCAYALGSRRYIRDAVIAFALSFVTYYVFAVGLGDRAARRCVAGDPVMNTLQLLIDGFATALTPINLLYAVIGVVLGTAVGVLPGIGPAMTVALLLPLTYELEPTSAFIMFAGIYYGGMYGGSTTSILLNTPG